jgi:hypothetical protein
MASPFRPISQTQLGKNLQGKTFGKTTALKNYAKKAAEMLGKKSVMDGELKRFTVRTFANKSAETVKRYLYRMGLDEKQRAEVMSTISPAEATISKEEQRRLDRVKSVTQKYNISEAQRLQEGKGKPESNFNSASNVHNVKAGESSNLTTGFAGGGNRSSGNSSGVANNPADNAVGVTGGSKNNSPVSGPSNPGAGHNMQF